MKRYLCLTLALLLSPPLSAAGAKPDLRGQLLIPLLHVLKTGNVAAIEALIGGDLLQEKKVLLRQNKAYSQFLRRYYKGASFEVSQVRAKNGKAAAKITIVFPGGEHQHFWLSLAKQRHPAVGKLRPNLGKQPKAVQWKIVDVQSREQLP